MKSNKISSRIRVQDNKKSRLLKELGKRKKFWWERKKHFGGKERKESKNLESKKLEGRKEGIEGVEKKVERDGLRKRRERSLF